MRKFALHIVFPTLVGTTIYLLFRTPSLLAFRWVEAIGVDGPVMVLRKCTSDVQLPAWILYSLPDGIWVYATTAWMLIIWRGAISWPWVSIGVLLAIASELGQTVGVVRGTYQSLDILFYLGGCPWRS